MRIWMCGVRGSTPATGADFAGIGGNTSCVAFAHDGQAPSLVLDAGTGLRRLSDVLAGAPFCGCVLLGHLHWDHMIGLPFFSAGDRDDATVRVLLPSQPGDAEALLGRAMSPPNFPITPAELRGRWSFDSIDEGTHEIEGFEVLAREIPHKGGRTFGYRITDQRGRCAAYLSDHAPQVFGPGRHGLGELHPAACALARAADLLIHDAQYTTAELTTRSRYGHSAAEYPAVLAAHVGVGRVLLFHHDPGRTDEQVREIASSVAAAHPNIAITAASEAMVIDL